MLPLSSFHPEDGGSKVLRNVGIRPHHFTRSHKPETTIKIFIALEKKNLIIEIKEGKIDWTSSSCERKKKYRIVIGKSLSNDVSKNERNLSILK